MERSSRLCALALAVALAGLACRLALAAEDLPTDDSLARGSAHRAGQAGMLLPNTLAATVGANPGVVSAISGFDGARGTAVFRAVADVSVWGPVALHLGATYLPGTPGERDMQPQIGLRVQLLDQRRHGLDLGGGLLFRRERYSQDGGELQLMVMAARRVGRLGWFANAAYGQDPEGDDRDGLLAVGALYTAGDNLQLGFDGRLRFDLFSSDGRRDARGEPGFDLMVGPTATVPIGGMALLGQVGYAAVKVGEVRSGVVAIGGLAWVF